MLFDRIGYLILTTALCFGCNEKPAREFATAASVPEKIDFNFHVRPILSDRCFPCHGPDEKARKADLRLDLEKYALAMLDSVDRTFAIIPGDSRGSQMAHRISSNDPEYMMPPPESNLSLSKYEIEVLKRWIEQGAEWKPHWAFIPPLEVEIPEVSTSHWPRNVVDHFILARLEQEALNPSPEASKEKLIRRLSFDLRGIPPSLEEIDAYLATDDANAYESLVDNFMSSDSYGERMALEWLDLARYADSHGYQDDLERSQWPWRDWVIKALNQNMPFDQFVTWQLAGDLMPDPTYEQRLATGFNRNHKITQEVGVIDEEYRVEYVLDRVNTFSTSFLGLTVACAQCHDHKFDPISQKEFYSVFSFFNNVPEKGRVEYGVEFAEPAIPLPEETIEKYTNYVKELVRSQQESLLSYEKIKLEMSPDVDIIPLGAASGSPAIPPGLVVYHPLDYLENEQVYEEYGLAPARVVNGLVPMPGKFSGALEFSGDNYLDLGPIAGMDFRRPVTLSFWFYSIDAGGRGTILSSNRDMDHANSGFALSVYNEFLEFETNRLVPSKDKAGSTALERLIMVKTRDLIPGNQWVHLALTYDGSGRAGGIKIFKNGVPQEVIEIQDQRSGTMTRPESIFIGRKDEPDRPNGLTRSRVDEIMVFNRALPPHEVESLAGYDPVAGLMAQSNRNEHQTKRLLYHQLHHQDPHHQYLTERLSEYKLREMRTASVVLNPTMIMAEMDTVRPTYVLDRGRYSAPKEQVYPATPEQVLPFPEEYPPDRLGLAQWLFDDRNPLTARVAVNRYWQLIFGRGIVSTPEDFGSQGSLPAHPELLDWLALEFRSSGWDLKHLIKTMVISSTYRQSVAIDPQLASRDPDNILLARGPQMQLPAEMIRDQALTVSGLLSDRVGGPSVKPYQPEGLWLQIASGNQPLKKYIQDHGQDLYRKSLYTFWKRSLPPPSMISFDASTREQCLVRRQSTSTPMQALVLLNDPQFTEAYRLIAQRMLTEGGEEARERISFAFRLATSRPPGPQEMQLLLDLLNDQKKTFTAKPERAASLLKVGENHVNADLDIQELAAYTVVASAIMNLTETIRKG